MRFMGLVIYLGIGFLVHVLFASAKIQWDSAWTWALLLGWPIPLALFIVAGIGLVIAVLSIAEYILKWERRRRARSRSSTG